MPSALVAESDSTLRRHVSGLLAKAGYRVHQVETGTEAIRMVARTPHDPFELLICNVVLDGIDGVELVKQSRILEPDIEAMFLTGFAVVPLTRSPRSTDATVLGKPFHLRLLPQEVISRYGPFPSATDGDR